MVCVEDEQKWLRPGDWSGGVYFLVGPWTIDVSRTVAGTLWGNTPPRGGVAGRLLNVLSITDNQNRAPDAPPPPSCSPGPWWSIVLIIYLWRYMYDWRPRKYHARKLWDGGDVWAFHAKTFLSHTRQHPVCGYGCPTFWWSRALVTYCDVLCYGYCYFMCRRLESPDLAAGKALRVIMKGPCPRSATYHGGAKPIASDEALHYLRPSRPNPNFRFHGNRAQGHHGNTVRQHHFHDPVLKAWEVKIDIWRGLWRWLWSRALGALVTGNWQRCNKGPRW